MPDPAPRAATAGRPEPVDGLAWRELLGAVVDQVVESVAVFDLDDWLVYANGAMAAAHGCTAQDLVGRHLHDFVPSPSPEVVQARADAERSGDGVLRTELTAPGPGGVPVHLEITVSALLDPADRLIGRIVLVRDVTERKLLETRLARAALHDPLTDLPNRRLLTERLERALTRAERTGTPVAVLFVDLDGFKTINDAHGHDAGDELLVQTAVRLQRCLRAADTLARLGGDELVVLLPDVTGTARAQSVADRMVEAMAEPFVLDGTSVRVSASIGVALSTSLPPRALLREADDAMYRAKAAGAGRVVVAAPRSSASHPSWTSEATYGPV